MNLLLGHERESPALFTATALAFDRTRLRLRLGRALTLLPIALIGLGLAALLLSFAVGADGASGVRLTTAAVAVVLGGGVGYLIADEIRQLRGGRLAIGAEQLSIEHRGLFSEPLIVPLEAVHAIAFAPAPDESLPISAAPPPGWALPWPWIASLPLPRLALQDTEPNSVIVFGRAFAAPGVRRRSRHGPLRREALIGVALRLEDPITARALLEGRGLVRPLSADDAAWVSAAVEAEAVPLPPGTKPRRMALATPSIHAGWATAVASALVPILGVYSVAVGAMLIGKREPAQGAAMIAVTVLAIAGWAAYSF